MVLFFMMTIPAIIAFQFVLLDASAVMCSRSTGVRRRRWAWLKSLTRTMGRDVGALPWRAGLLEVFSICPQAFYFIPEKVVK